MHIRALPADMRRLVLHHRLRVNTPPPHPPPNSSTLHPSCNYAPAAILHLTCTSLPIAFCSDALQCASMASKATRCNQVKPRRTLAVGGRCLKLHNVRVDTAAAAVEEADSIVAKASAQMKSSERAVKKAVAAAAAVTKQLEVQNKSPSSSRRSKLMLTTL